MITLTKKAAKEILKVSDADFKEGETTFLRVGVKGGGCGGYQYSLDVVTAKSETDEDWEYHGVTVICDAKSHLYLDGTTIDFKDELMGRGFVFKNVQHTTCGCGSSFS